MPAIDVRELKKSYWLSNRSEGLWGSVKGFFYREQQELVAVNGVSFSIQPGELVAFLGPNGAGKTTTLKMLSGLLQPTSGMISVLGTVPFEKKPEFLRRFSFVMGQRHQLWWELPALDTFRLNAAIFGLSALQYKNKLEELNQLLQLDPQWHTPVKKLSLGQRMKMELACSLLHDPELLLLDEPTIGLDVMMQKTLRDFVARINQEKKTTVLLTSHNMEDIETLCKRAIVIHHGALLFDGELSALMTRFSASKQVSALLQHPVDLKRCQRYGPVLSHREDQVSWEIPREGVSKQVGLMLQDLPIMDLSIEEMPLEEVIRKVFLEGKL